MKSFLLRPALLSIMFIIAGTASPILFSSAFAADNSNSGVFTFTAIPDQDETRLKQRFNKVAAYLEQKLGSKVRYIPVKSYSAAITAFRNNEVQLAWFGGLSGVQARRLVPGSEAIAQGEEDQYFRTLLIAHNRTGLKKSVHLPEDISSFTFTFGSKGSTSGRLMPEFYLQQHYGKPSDKLFKRVGFSGDHSRTIALVQSGAYDLGAVNFKVWEKELSEGKIDADNISVIWETPNYPDYQWTIRGDIDNNWGEGFSNKIRDALLSMEQEDLLQAFPRTRFVPAHNSDYDMILNTAKSIGLID